MLDHNRQLIEAAFPFWEAEGEITRRFFARGPSPEDQLFWLRAQLWKELHPVDGYFSGMHQELTGLANLFPQVDRGIGRHQFASLMKQMLEEFNHYVLFADILERLTGRPIQDSDRVQLPEEQRLQALRRRYASSGSALDKAAVLFTEGGGARMFREGAKLAGGDLECMIAAAMKTIYDDEKDHFLEAARDAQALLESQADVERLCATIIDVSRQRVAMRREMFRNAMSEAEAEAFIASTRAAVQAGQFTEHALL
jgi:hypothetical protein